MNYIQPLVLTDFYKTDHRRQYPEKTTMVYSNLTPRGSRIPGIDKVVVFGLQYFITKYLEDDFTEGFFGVPKDRAVREYKRRLDNALGKDAVPMDHIEKLHDLGYLPLEIKALPEGTLCPMRVPMLTIRNTHADFFWLTNFFETLLSCVVWGPTTSATIAFEYRKLFQKYANETSDIVDFVQWQGHDFSMRGMHGVEAAMTSGAGHLLSFTGTDTIPAIDFLEEYYGADSDKELIGASVPATEHSVMSLGGRESEIETFRRLMKLYPKGILSIVSDTWDYWRVIMQVARGLKDEIMARDGKIVFRPDSGDPYEIIVGSGNNLGSVEALWDIFGGTINSKGYKQLDPHVGLIYGDSITLDLAARICEGLKQKGFATTNLVFGIGSYTYQYVTRDTFGFAMKATAGMVDDEFCEIYKDPKTDDGLKKSARGLLQVTSDLKLKDQVTWEEEAKGVLVTVYKDGDFCHWDSLSDIRGRLLSQLEKEIEATV